MKESPVGSSVRFAGVKQVCVVVRNLEDAIERYSRYGFGPWFLFRYDDIAATVRGEDQVFSIRIALTKLGDDFQWELIQPLDDRSIYGQFLREHGEGVQHVGFDVDDVPATIEAVGPLLSSRNAGLRGGIQQYAMLDTVGDLGVLAEVMDYTPGWVRPGADGMIPTPKHGVVPELTY
jgi:catechol 2,3-dioxygenase-like lactoylglutathione lyase family enzyme